MQIQVNTDNNIEGQVPFLEGVRDSVAARLERFEDRITRVEVHLSDVNAHKGGRDTRCVIEARLRGLQPITVDDLSRTVDEAVREAVRKMERALDSRLGKLGRE